MSGRPRPYTLEDLQENFRLGGEDGETLIKNKRGKGCKFGKPAPVSVGTNRYLNTEFYVGKRRVHVAVHVAKFALAHGYVPEEVDHRDGNRLNCALSNLRACTTSQNCMNRRPVQKPSGLPRGVRKAGKKYEARVGLHGSLHYGGVWPTIEEAEQAAIALRIQLHGEFARHD